MNTILPSIGTTLKILVSFEVEGKTMDECDFSCCFYSSETGRSVTKEKSDCLRVDESSYVAVIDTNDIGVGHIKCKLVVDVPDPDCPQGKRREVVRTSANVNVVA